MLPVVEPDGESTARRMVLYAVGLLLFSLIPRWTGMAGNVYLVGAFALGLYFLYAAAKVTRDRTRQRARQVLLASVAYLPLLYVLLLIDRTA
jgi:protoheme IX farnesyltransferase